MEPRSTREVAVPAVTPFRILRAVRAEAGAPVAVRALHAVGYQAGEELAEAIGTRDETPIDAPTFWNRLRDHFEEKGWGTLDHEPIHAAFGALTSTDWAEAAGSGEASPACAYTSGILAALLSRAAGGSVAVLETECRSSGHDRCAFVFGSEPAVDALHERLLDGQGLAAALARI